MKFYNSHFEDYIIKFDNSLHPYYNKIYNELPKDIYDLNNIIFYGAKGIGKYTQVLNVINKYSSHNLKYEKKINIMYNKKNYYFKLSDIHFEIDISLLGCNNKVLWEHIFNNIVDIIVTKKHKIGIVLCKNFHEINTELLDIFYSYMQTYMNSNIKIIFFFITEAISFIPDNIINVCKIFNYARPSRNKYNKILNITLNKEIEVNNITNIKNLFIINKEFINFYKKICMKIIDMIIHVEDLNYFNLRENIYDLFIYNLDIFNACWYILNYLILNNHIKDEEVTDIVLYTYRFFKYYNNNYRPIYHLENYIIYLINKVHGYKISTNNIKLESPI